MDQWARGREKKERKGLGVDRYCVKMRQNASSQAPPQKIPLNGGTLARNAYMHMYMAGQDWGK